MTSSNLVHIASGKGILVAECNLEIKARVALVPCELSWPSISLFRSTDCSHWL